MNTRKLFQGWKEAKDKKAFLDKFLKNHHLVTIPFTDEEFKIVIDGQDLDTYGNDILALIEDVFPGRKLKGFPKIEPFRRKSG